MSLVCLSVHAKRSVCRAKIASMIHPLRCMSKYGCWVNMEILSFVASYFEKLFKETFIKEMHFTRHYFMVFIYFSYLCVNMF